MKYLVYSLISQKHYVNHNTVYKFNTVICWLLNYMYIKMYKWHWFRYLHTCTSNNTYLLYRQSDSDKHDTTDLRFLYTTFSWWQRRTGVYWLLQFSLTQCLKFTTKAMYILLLVARFGTEVLIYSSTLENPR